MSMMISSVQSIPMDVEANKKTIVEMPKTRESALQLIIKTKLPGHITIHAVAYNTIGIVLIASEQCTKALYASLWNNCLTKRVFECISTDKSENFSFITKDGEITYSIINHEIFINKIKASLA